MDTRRARITQVLSQALTPSLLLIEDESHHHSGHRHETHFKILIVSSHFAGKARIERQRMVNSLLEQELASGLHALTQKTLTPEEWEGQKGKVDFESPACLGLNHQTD